MTAVGEVRVRISGLLIAPYFWLAWRMPLILHSDVLPAALQVLPQVLPARALAVKTPEAPEVKLRLPRGW